MTKKEEWAESKAKERQSQNFVQTVLDLAGYNVMDYGVENHCMDIVKEIKGSYKSETNSRILSMPDYVVIDPDTKKAELVEVKYRSQDYFDWKKSTFLFGFKNIKQYVDYWIDATIVIVMEVKPYCVCVRVRDIDWSRHLVGKRETSKGVYDEIWNFSGRYHIINDIFPRISDKYFMKALHLSGIRPNILVDDKKTKKVVVKQ